MYAFLLMRSIEYSAGGMRMLRLAKKNSANPPLGRDRFSSAGSAEEKVRGHPGHLSEVCG